MFDKYFARIGGVFTIIGAAITPFLPKNTQSGVFSALVFNGILHLCSHRDRK